MTTRLAERNESEVTDARSKAMIGQQSSSRQTVGHFDESGAAGENLASKVTVQGGA